MIDMTDTIAPKSNQLNADDLITGPITVRITKVSKPGGTEQPIAINYDGDRGKPYYPCKTMRRLMVHVWGKDGASYVGQSMTLICDPTVKYGGAEVGGIRISHMTGLREAKAFALAESKTKRVAYRVTPLAVEVRKEPLTLDNAKSAADFLTALETALQDATTPAEVDAVLSHSRVKAAGDTLKNDALARYTSIISEARAKLPPVENDPALAGDDTFPGDLP